MTEPPVLGPDRRSVDPPAPSPSHKAGWLLQSRASIFVLLFCVTGFLGIPLLWMSPRFSRTEKWVWSVIVTIYTCILIGGTMAVLWWSWSRVSQSIGM